MTTNNNQRVRPPSERRYFANMMVTLGTNQRVRGSLDEKMRALLAASTAAAGGSGSTTGTTGTVADAESDVDAGRLEKEKEASPRQLPRVGDLFLHNHRTWSKESTGGLESADEALRPELYQATLLDSVFTLSPSGHNPETFRIFEAAEAGSIPIVDNATAYYAASTATTAPVACSDPWRPFLASGAPFVWVQTWDRVEETLKALRAEGPAAAARRQSKLREWYAAFMRAGAAAVESTLRAHEGQALAGQQR